MPLLFFDVPNLWSPSTPPFWFKVDGFCCLKFSGSEKQPLTITFSDIRRFRKIRLFKISIPFNFFVLPQKKSSPPASKRIKSLKDQQGKPHVRFYPEKIYSRTEVMSKPSPVPPVNGIYFWWFKEIPRVYRQRGTLLLTATLLYVGISTSEET